MKKVTLIATALVSYVAVSFASSDEFLELQEWLGKYYCEQNNVEWISPQDPRYSEYKSKGEGIFSLPPLTLQNDLYKKIKQEFPMDPQMQAAIAAIESQKVADYNALAQKYGCSSWDELMKKDKYDPIFQNNKIWDERQKIDDEYGTEYSKIVTPYYTEFNKRYENAVIEAIKRIQENAKTMNPQR